MQQKAQQAAWCTLWQRWGVLFREAVHKEISDKCEIHVLRCTPDREVPLTNVLSGYPHDPVPDFVTYHAMPLDANNNIRVLMQKLGHTGRTIKLLKVSCNGCEIATHQGWLAGDTKIDPRVHLVFAEIKEDEQ